jgi:hypothetical protein
MIFVINVMSSHCGELNKELNICAMEGCVCMFCIVHVTCFETHRVAGTQAPVQVTLGFPPLAPNTISCQSLVAHPHPRPKSECMGVSSCVSHRRHPLSPPTLTLAPNASACGLPFGYPIVNTLPLAGHHLRGFAPNASVLDVTTARY